MEFNASGSFSICSFTWSGFPLKEFVAEAIVQITQGITEAQEKLTDEWMRINPKPPEGVNVVGPMLYTAENGAGVFPLTFVVAVSAEDKQGDVGV